MPRTMFVLPTSTTRRLDDIGSRLLRQNQIAGAHRDRLVAAAQQCASVVVDAAPGADDRAIADHARDALAGAVHGSGAPFFEHAIALERLRPTLADALDECDRRVFDAVKRARRQLADRRRVLLFAHRLDVDAGPDEQICADRKSTR